MEKKYFDTKKGSVEEKINIIELSNKMIGIFLKLYPSKDIQLSSNLEKGYVLSSFEDMEEVIGNIVENK